MPNANVATDQARIEELTAIIKAVRDRVRARYPEPDGDGYTSGASNGNAAIRIPIADLTPVIHARDAAQAKIAAIGSVNPRESGFVNDAIQSIKRLIARALRWFVRDQVAFNRETVAAFEAVIEALNEHNRGLVSLAAQANSSLATRTELTDMSSQFSQLRAEWESRVAANEIQFLRSVAELQGAFQHRVTLMESSFRELVKSQHADFQGALDRANFEMWRELEKIRLDYERLIHAELRMVRQRATSQGVSEPAVTTPLAPAASASVASPSVAEFDYSWFAERFRGPEEYVRKNVEFYRRFFTDCENVLDIGCGRGEFLTMMGEQGVRAKGIDLSGESVARCTESGLDAEIADLFAFLPAQPPEAFDGIFSSQVVEHIDALRLPEMIRLCASRMKRGGILAIETPNPACLAIFATHFYLDPTHVRPVPHPLLAFYMEEAGLGGIEVHELSPAVESMPELGELPETFRKRFFGGLDYAIMGRKL